MDVLAFLYPALRPLLFALDAETAHRLTIKALRILPRGPVPAHNPALRVTLWDRHFPNPVGLAAGFDKNAEIIAPMLGLGFGFVEAGTVTPKPQPGNPRPRIFRDPENDAVINRMGFPSVGMNAFKANLEEFLETRPRPEGLVGINIGMNKSQTDPARDYMALVRTLGPFADYITVNISSPNTPGLRDLQEPQAFRDLAGQLLEERARACGRHMPPPLLVKLSPDLGERQQEDLARAALDSGIDGLILTNTTLDRPVHLPESFREEKGGLSGQPLSEKSTDMIRNFYRLTGGKLPIIGAGGVSSGLDAYDKIRAGASLVQIYSALAFQGPGVVKRITAELAQLLKKDGYATIDEAVGKGI
ncbi:MAG: quinone-dependent dihydroorotate dehydrogenase [Micavibrio aeruginosavorus]|nr:quinone-dependent dihydroorotate dehydrogenase [Micavibrio aeruginosavorus]